MLHEEAMTEVLEWIVCEYQRNNSIKEMMKLSAQESIFTFQVGVAIKQISNCIANCSYLLVLFTQAKDTVNSLELHKASWHNYEFTSIKIETMAKRLYVDLQRVFSHPRRGMLHYPSSQLLPMCNKMPWMKPCTRQMSKRRSPTLTCT